jgi:hypothetical protein
VFAGGGDRVTPIGRIYERGDAKRVLACVNACKGSHFVPRASVTAGPLLTFLESAEMTTTKYTTKQAVYDLLRASGPCCVCTMAAEINQQVQDAPQGFQLQMRLESILNRAMHCGEIEVYDIDLTSGTVSLDVTAKGHGRMKRDRCVGE